MEKNFDRRLKSLLSTNGVKCEELALCLGVSVPTVNRWLIGISTPNAYQLREISHLFGMPNDWFLEDGGGIPDAEELAPKLGLFPETVEALLDMAAEGDNTAVLEAVDQAVCAVLAVVDGVFKDLDNYVDEVIAERGESVE